MKKRTKRIYSAMSLLLILSIFSAFAAGQKEAPREGSSAVVYPEKGRQLRLLITHDLGGSVDISSRGIAPYLEKYLGIPVITENMVGAGGRRAMEYAFAAPPDGYTIVASAYPSRLLGEFLYPESKYRMKDFVHLGAWTGGDFRVVVVAKDSPYRTFQDLMEAGKTRKLKAAGGGGLGSTSQLQTVFLRERIKMNVDFIPFDSGGEVGNAVIGKHVDFGVLPLANGRRYLEQGDMRILAIHAPKRSPFVPDVPTMEELGYKGVVVSNGTGAWAPPKTPPEIQKALGDAIQKALKDPEFIVWSDRMKQMLDPMGPENFLQATLADYENFSGVIDLLKADAARN